MFKDTAYYYLKYRVPYPHKLLDDLLKRAKIDGKGKLLDLACGSGRVALALSSHFREAWAVDCESEMIKIANTEAKRLQKNNLHWITNWAENFEAPSESFQLITIGEAFHRLNQPLIMERSFEWLSTGCCLATMGCFGITKGNEPWQIILRKIVRSWNSQEKTTNCSKEGNRATYPRGSNYEKMAFKAFGFKNVETYEFSHPYIWTLDSIIGYLYSTSICSKQTLGNQSEQLEADIRSALSAYGTQDGYPETLRFYYTLAVKP